MANEQGDQEVQPNRSSAQRLKHANDSPLGTGCVLSRRQQKIC
jgi:hypothetical protein